MNRFNIKWISVGIFILLLGIILIQNAGVVSLNILFWEVAMSKAIFYPLLFLMGIGVGLIIAFIWHK